MGEDKSFDAIVLGAGHNGLILQAYLCRAGLDVICLERSDKPGGGLATVEDPRYPGFLHNTHSFFHRAITQMPWFGDLHLERYGARYIEPELNVALVLRNGDVLKWYTDFERTEDSFARFSKRDAQTLRRWRDAFDPVVRNILSVEAQAPPLPQDLRQEILSQTQEGKMLLEVSALSPLEFVNREFEHPVIRAGLLFFNGLREVDLRARGFGHHIPALLASKGKAQMCVGGAAGLARALVAAISDMGGEIWLQTEPGRIVVEDNRVRGVETADGKYIKAPVVVSSLNPHQTFFDLIDREVLPGTWQNRVEQFQYNVLAPLFALHLNLSEAPRYRAVEKHPEVADALMVILGLEHADQYGDIVAHHEKGTIPPPVMWGACPTHFDTTQAPLEKHTAFMWQKLPFHLYGDSVNWDRQRDAVGRDMLDMWSEYAPNLRDCVIDSFVRSPLDVERALPNMRDGDLLVGAFTNGQTGYNRPFPGAGHYRGCFEGLYLCGSCCHPGGNVTGLPGYNAAQVIHSDLGITGSWIPDPVDVRLGG